MKSKKFTVKYQINLNKKFSSGNLKGLKNTEVDGSGYFVEEVKATSFSEVRKKIRERFGYTIKNIKVFNL